MKVVTDLSVTSAPARARHGWHPGWLFRGGVQGAWYDPSDLSTLFQDVAGTVPVVADGDPVALIVDKSGNGHHLTQPVAPARPIYRTDTMLNWIEFDGADDRMTAAGYSLAAPLFSVCTGLVYLPVGSSWGSIKSVSGQVVYVGLSNPVASGSTSNVGGVMTLNRAPAPNDRITLRTALQSPGVISVKDAHSTSFNGREVTLVGYSTIAPPAARLFGFVERAAANAADIARMELWMANKTGVTL